MIVIEKFEAALAQLDERKWYTWSSVFLGCIAVLVLAVSVYYFWDVHDLKKQINMLNESRDEVRALLTRAQYVQKQRQEVDAMLTSEKDFKLAEHVSTVLAKLGIKETMMQDSRFDREGKYQEVILEVTLDDINMRQLAEFLNEVGKNRRVYTKKLDIMRSKKKPSTLEVNVSFATLLLK